jgi:hypothetical protein
VTNLVEFLFPAPARRTTAGIVRWWESRRLAYNLIVGATGALSLVAIRVITWLPPAPHDVFLDGRPVVVFGVLANLFYLLGPTLEIGIEKLGRGTILPTGPTLYRMGLTFSVGLAFFPTMIAGLDWAFRILRVLF